MTTTTQRIINAAAILLASAIQLFGVVGQRIEVQGTNLVLSWPSTGNEYYMVQYRPTLDPSTPWLQLTNAYRANSTNRTTYVIPCCALVELAGTNLMMISGGGSGGESMSAESLAAMKSEPRLWVMTAAGIPIPLAIYPPGVDTNGFIIFEPGKCTEERSKVQKHL